MTDNLLSPVAVLGAGSWGTALAILLARNGNPTRLWGRDKNKMEQMRKDRVNARYLPDTPLPEKLSPEHDLQQAVEGAQDILISVPAKGFRQTLKNLAPLINNDVCIAFATKGMEPETFQLLHTVIAEELGEDRTVAVLSGPTFAKEVAAGLPTAITVASENETFAQDFAERLHNETFRSYTSHDVAGVEVGGASKNVMAIAAGIADGMKLGANTRAALITRGLVEIQRLGVAMGGHKETFMGLAGLGDLVLTCTDNLSRNRRVGLALAEGKKLPQILEDLGQVAEGVYTAQELVQLAKKFQIEMPISEQVYQVIYQNKDPHQAVHDLLARSLKPED